MSQRQRWRTAHPFTANRRSNRSMETPVRLMSNNSSRRSRLSRHRCKRPSYSRTGSRWIKGRWEHQRLLHTCWWPPKGICQAGNPQKMTPSDAKKWCAWRMKSLFRWICSHALISQGFSPTWCSQKLHLIFENPLFSSLFLTFTSWLLTSTRHFRLALYRPNWYSYLPQWSAA